MPSTVADGTVDDDAAERRADGRAAHELTEDGARGVAVRAHDDDVAGLCDLERLVDHQVVRGTRVDGDGTPQSGTPERGRIRSP
jgi:hypothetical protein